MMFLTTPTRTTFLLARWRLPQYSFVRRITRHESESEL